MSIHRHLDLNLNEGARALPALNGDLPSHVLDQNIGQKHAEPMARGVDSLLILVSEVIHTFLLYIVEQFEQAIQLLRSHSNAGVLDFD